MISDKIWIENLEILIDGNQNELTKKVGYETFINDFILPREIAKFFFFDSEKIVSLAEAKTKDELKSLSSAYSEVLGLKKYGKCEIINEVIAVDNKNNECAEAKINVYLRDPNFINHNSSIS